MRKKVLLALAEVAVVGAAVMIATIGPGNVVGMIRCDQRRKGDLKVGRPSPPDATMCERVAMNRFREES